jgi:putative endopeptidase
VFVNANFEFYGKKMSPGAMYFDPDGTGVATRQLCLGEAVGQLYVGKIFSSSGQRRMLHLVENLKTSW